MNPKANAPAGFLLTMSDEELRKIRANTSASIRDPRSQSPALASFGSPSSTPASTSPIDATKNNSEAPARKGRRQPLALLASNPGAAVGASPPIAIPSPAPLGGTLAPELQAMPPEARRSILGLNPAAPKIPTSNGPVLDPAKHGDNKGAQRAQSPKGAPRNPFFPPSGGGESSDLGDAFPVPPSSGNDSIGGEKKQGTLNLGPLSVFSNELLNSKVRLGTGCTVLQAIRYLGNCPMTLHVLSSLRGLSRDELTTMLERVCLCFNSENDGSDPRPNVVTRLELFFAVGYMLMGPKALDSPFDIFLNISDIIIRFDRIIMYVLPHLFQTGLLLISTSRESRKETEWVMTIPKDRKLPPLDDYVYVAGNTLTFGLTRITETLCLKVGELFARVKRNEFSLKDTLVWWDGLTAYLLLSDALPYIEQHIADSKIDVDNALNSLGSMSAELKQINSMIAENGKWTSSREGLINGLGLASGFWFAYLDYIDLRQAAIATGMLKNTFVRKYKTFDQILEDSKPPCIASVVVSLITSNLDFSPYQPARSLIEWLTFVCKVITSKEEKVPFDISRLGYVYKPLWNKANPKQKDVAKRGSPPDGKFNDVVQDAPAVKPAFVEREPFRRGSNLGLPAPRPLHHDDVPPGDADPPVRPIADSEAFHLHDRRSGAITEQIEEASRQGREWSTGRTGSAMIDESSKVFSIFEGGDAGDMDEALTAYINNRDLVNAKLYFTNRNVSSDLCYIYSHFSCPPEDRRSPVNSIKDITYEGKSFRCRLQFYSGADRSVPNYQILTMLGQSNLVNSATPELFMNHSNENCIIRRGKTLALLRGGARPEILLKEILRSQSYMHSPDLFSSLFGGVDLDSTWQLTSYVDRVMSPCPFVPFTKDVFMPFANYQLPIEVTPGSLYIVSGTVGPKHGDDEVLRGLCGSDMIPVDTLGNPKSKDLLGVDQQYSRTAAVSVNNVPLRMECRYLQTIPATDTLEFVDIKLTMDPDNHDSRGRTAILPRDRSTFLGSVTSFNFTVNGSKGDKATTINAFGRNCSRRLNMEPIRINQRASPCPDIFISGKKEKTEEARLAKPDEEKIIDVDICVTSEMTRLFALGTLPSKLAFNKAVLQKLPSTTSAEIEKAIDKLTKSKNRTTSGMLLFLGRYQKQRG